MKGYEVLAAALQAELDGAPIFGLVGDGNMHCLSVLAAHGSSRFVSVNHEAAAVAAADGFATSTGKVGMATVTCGPGLTQVATSLIAAARSRTPLVLFAGDTPRSAVGDVQELDQTQFIKACEAHPVVVETPDDLADGVARAFHRARNVGGPVVLNVPIDVQLAEVAGDFVARPTERFDAVQLPSPHDLQQLADEISRSARPIVLLGRGARASTPTDSVIEFARRAGALIGTTMPCRGWLEHDPFSIGVIGGFASAVTAELCAESDLVVCIGASLDAYTTSSGGLFPAAKVVHVDIVRPRTRPVQARYQFMTGDAADVIEALTRLLPETTETVGQRAPDVLERLTEARRFDPVAGEAQDGIDPRTAMHLLGRALPERPTVVCGAGHFWAFPIQYLALPEGTSFHASYHFGSIGQTLPFALGVAHGAGPVVMLDGDGSFLMHLQELDTAARHRLPVKILIMNDRAYGAELHRMPLFGIDSEHSLFTRPDFAAVARSFGVPAARADDDDQLRDALGEAMSANGPFLIDIQISPHIMCSPYQQLYGEVNHVPLVAGPADSRILASASSPHSDKETS